MDLLAILMLCPVVMGSLPYRGEYPLRRKDRSLELRSGQSAFLWTRIYADTLCSQLSCICDESYISQLMFDDDGLQ